MTTSDGDTGLDDPADPDDLDHEDASEDDDRSGPGTALWITLVIAALVLGGAIGWRITKWSDAAERPAHDSVDVGFFQDMGTHHAQAVAMSFIYLDHGTDPLLRGIATEIINYQASEIGVMNDHLADWNEQGTEDDTAMGWMGMKVPRAEMTGMATAPQMRELQDARGRELDDLYSRLLIRHHEGGVHMAEYAAEHATTETVRSWAEAMDEGQRGEIAELNRWRVAHDLPAVKLTLIS